MKILITGGHFTPALAIIDLLKQSEKNEIIVVGRKHAFANDRAPSFEFEVSKQKKIQFINIDPPRLSRSNPLKTAQNILKLPTSLQEASTIIKQVQPDAVLTFGGYLSAPIALAAKQKKIPIIIHEQTQNAGAANKLLAKIADKICISFPSSARHFPKQKTVFTGNPLRKEIFEVKKQIEIKNNKNKIIYITGGSTGAHIINQTVQTILPKLLKKYTVIHQTGATTLTNDYEKLNEFKKNLNPDLEKNYIVKKYVTPEEIGWVYKNADLVVSRAGMNTVLELAALNKKALLIPLEAGQKNEQYENAKLLEETCSANILRQKNLTSKNLLNEIENTIEANQSKNIKTDDKLCVPDAAEKIVKVIKELI